MYSIIANYYKIKNHNLWSLKHIIPIKKQCKEENKDCKPYASLCCQGYTNIYTKYYFLMQIILIEFIKVLFAYINYYYIIKRNEM